MHIEHSTTQVRQCHGEMPQGVSFWDRMSDTYQGSPSTRGLSHKQSSEDTGPQSFRASGEDKKLRGFKAFVLEDVASEIQSVPSMDPHSGPNKPCSCRHASDPNSNL